MSRGRRSRDRGYISGNRVTSAPTYDEVVVNYLVVAGGGGGGSNTGVLNGGGGGAGGLRSTVTATGGGGSLETPLTVRTNAGYTVTVGAGGIHGTQGTDSVFSTITSTGGGRGGGDPSQASNGGSGGGARGQNGTQGLGTTNQGFNGGTSVINAAAGGGGAGAAGANATGASDAGAGGNGVATSITGSSVTYAGGGAGGGATTASGGSGGGASGAALNTVPNNATANTGGGGAGAYASATTNGSSGGSGVVILRYSNLYTLNIGAGLSYSTQTVNDDKVTTFTSGSGSISLSPAPVTTGDYESIATVLVGTGGASTVTFSNIPQIYKHLQIRIHDMPSADHNVTVRFNGDSGSNYSYHNLSGNGSTAASVSSVPETLMYLPGSSGGVGYPLVVVCDILDYADTNKFKTVRALGGNDNNSTQGVIAFRSNNWRSTSAVTSIVLSGNYAQYSHFALYGIRG